MFTPNQQNCSHPNQGPSHRAGNPGGNTAPARRVEASPAGHVGLLARAFWRFVRWIYLIMPVPGLRASIQASGKTPSLVRSYMATQDVSLMHLVSSRFVVDTFHRASSRVPAYQHFLKERGVDPRAVRTPDAFDRQVPATDRTNYVMAYPIRERCVDGRLPDAGAIDESAGSTGEPLNWIRSAREIGLLEDIFKIGVDLFFGGGSAGRPSILINAFSCGAWAGGFRFGSALESWALVKNTGPDFERIYRTLRSFGPREHYLIAGYPPFLKELVRTLQEQPGFELKAYRIDIMTGGEGFPEGWRRFMESELRKGSRILSGYGASDLEVGIATETPYSVAILKLLSENESLRKALLGTERDPVFFGQYNPTSHYIRPTTNSRGQTELEVTVLNRYSASPKIKYCVGDEGDLISFEQVRRVLAEGEVECPEPPVALPFLFLFGRSDGTVSIDGANVYPETINAALQDHPIAAHQIATFKMGVSTPDMGPTRLAILLQAARGVEPSDRLTRLCKDIIIQKLLTANLDFRESFKDNPKSADPMVRVVPFESEIFSNSPHLVKHSYFLEREKV